MTFNHLQTIIQQVDEVRRAFESAGKKIYLVGGIVRDLYGNATNIQNLDIDLTTNATPEEIKVIIKPIADNLWLSGEKFGTIGAHVNGKTIEITTHRSESYLSDSRKPIVDINFNLTDLKSRTKNFLLHQIKNPDDDLIFALIIKNLSDRQISLDKKKINFIIKRIDRSYSKIFDFIYKIDEISLRKKKSIDFNMIKNALGVS